MQSISILNPSQLLIAAKSQLNLHPLLKLSAILFNIFAFYSQEVKARLDLLYQFKGLSSILVLDVISFLASNFFKIFYFLLFSHC